MNNQEELPGMKEPTEAPRKKKSWAELRDDVRNIRRRLWGLGYRLPHSFTFRKMTGKTRIYFMSSPPNCRDNSVFSVDVPEGALPWVEGDEHHRSKYPWTQILASGFQVCLHSIFLYSTEGLYFFIFFREEHPPLRPNCSCWRGRG